VVGPPLILSCVLAAIAYAPAITNGFIADDYVILQRTGFMRGQPLYLLQVPPENFRLTSYAVFAFLKSVTGYDSRIFYAFNIGLHLANIALLHRLLMLVLNDEFVANTACLLFAVFQAPQEAVMWLAAMNETTLAFFTLISLLMWWQKRYFTAAASYALALFSKESGLIILLLIALVDLKQRQWKPYRAYALMLVPTAVFVAVFLSTMSANFMLTNRFYSVGPHAILVLLLSFHRLIWPWLYLVLLLVWIGQKGIDRRKSLASLPANLAMVLVLMLPYMFIAYQNSLPSRQLYMASAALMTTFALLLRGLQGRTMLRVFIVVFVAFNIGYLWWRKDAQFEQRAAPTNALIARLRQHNPQPALVLNFAYPYPAIARAAALAVPGWTPELIMVDESPEKCAGCLILRWNAQDKRYD
jgi:hypothetical protein